MAAKAVAVVFAAALSSAVAASTVEASAEFALDNVLAPRTVRSGDTVLCVRDASWAAGGVTFSMSGAADQVLSEGLAETLVIPAVAHYRVLTLGLAAGGERYSYSFLVRNGEPNAVAEASGTFALDSRTGTVRTAKPCETIAYSDAWSAGASGPSLSVTKPDGAAAAIAAAGEGAYLWAVEAPFAPRRIAPGLYTFTHDDGIETLTAAFRVSSRGFGVFFR